MAANFLFESGFDDDEAALQATIAASQQPQPGQPGAGGSQQQPPSGGNNDDKKPDDDSSLLWGWEFMNKMQAIKLKVNYQISFSQWIVAERMDWMETNVPDTNPKAVVVCVHAFDFFLLLKITYAHIR